MIRVKDWKHFQHFKDRRPPWIKLYREILDDPDWHELNGEAAKGLVMLWLIASEYDGYLPDCKKLSFRLRLTTEKTKSLIEKLSHWLEQVDDNVASGRCQGDAPETETEGETEKEKALSGKPDLKTPALEILSFLNEKAGRAYEPSAANLEFIFARLKEGHSVDDIRSVVAKKCREWLADEKMAQYLRPATLFNRTKFAQYKGELK